MNVNISPHCQLFVICKKLNRQYSQQEILHSIPPAVADPECFAQKRMKMEEIGPGVRVIGSANDLPEFVLGSSKSVPGSRMSVYRNISKSLLICDIKNTDQQSSVLQCGIMSCQVLLQLAMLCLVILFHVV